LTDFPYPRTDLSHDLCDGYAKGGEAVPDGDADLKLRDLTIKVPRGQALAQQFDTVHPGFDAASAVTAFGAAFEPMAGWPLTIVAGWSGRSVWMHARPRCATAPAVSGFHGLAFLRGGMMAAAPRAAMASWHVAGVEGTVGSDAGDFLIVWDLVEKLGQHPSPVRSKPVALAGSTSSASLVVSSAARISNVFASISPLGECAIRLPGNGCGSCAVSHVAPLV
jgi:hypothetical protein